MLLIACPWCGERDETEFRCTGEAAIRRPADPVSSDAAAWAGYLYHRVNTRGAHEELWFHVHGCGQFFAAERDTLTHRFGATRPLRGTAS